MARAQAILESKGRSLPFVINPLPGILPEAAQLAWKSVHDQNALTPQQSA